MKEFYYYIKDFNLLNELEKYYYNFNLKNIKTIIINNIEEQVIILNIEEVKLLNNVSKFLNSINKKEVNSIGL